MSLPLVVLGACSVFAGFIDLPFHPHFDFLERWLNPVVGANLFDHHESTGALWAFGVADGALAVLGVALAMWLWRSVVDRPARAPLFVYGLVYRCEF